MLSPEIIKKIKKVHIKSARMVNTMMAGQYRSIFRGSGIEFEEVREYSPGDDVKSIDWKVSARMGRPYVKLYREERELVVMLLMDMSASEGFGTTDNLKKDIAAEIASILAFNAIRNNDKVGAILFTDRVEKYIPPKKGSAHVWRVIKELFSFEPEHTGTDIREAVAFLGRVSRKRTISFLISDFLSPEPSATSEKSYIRRMKSLSGKHELIAVMLSDPGEFHLPEAGILTLRDFETGRQILLDASDATTRQHYHLQKTRDYAQTLQSLKTADMDCIEIQTSGSVVDALNRYFRIREKRKR
ncbi:MAG: DUF58 domain-containing protein [Desulfatirhabdiaceae bacterium]